jgi:hypothetical protein
MKHGMKSHDPVGLLPGYPAAPGAGGITQFEAGMLLQPGDQADPRRFFHLQTADVGQPERRGIVRFHPGFLKGIFYAVIGKECALPGSFYQTVAASVVPVRDPDRDGDPRRLHPVGHVVAVHTGAHRAYEGVGSIEKPHDMGYIIGTSSYDHGLGRRMEIFLSDREMVKMNDNVHTGGTDDQCRFHNKEGSPFQNMPQV